MAKAKNLAVYRYYVICVIIFGALGLLVFSLITGCVKGRSDWKNKIIIIFSAVLMAVNIFVLAVCTYPEAAHNKKIDYYGFNSSIGIFEKENGEKIRYNNKGEAFTLGNMDGFSFYSESDNKYSFAVIYDNSNRAYDYVVDEKGFIKECKPDELTSVYLGDDLYAWFDDKELYYAPENCYYDSNGKLLLNNNMLKKLTYELLVEFYCNQEYNLEFAHKNDKGEYVYYDKMGNEYSIIDWRNGKVTIPLYDKLGNKYTEFFDEKKQYTRYADSQNNLYDGYIDEDGYFVIDDGSLELSVYIQDLFTSQEVYYDDEGHLYYNTHECYWDAEGNLENYTYVTYDEIKEKENL
ncbi:MAG: hypothetical protein NC227_08220 [Bacteroides sp.]|nr:hypothetical protein [Bacteroides sp.]